MSTKNIEQLCCIANISEFVAKNLLEACNNNIEMALNMHIEGSFEDANTTSYSSCFGDDNIRAPIPQKQEVLVEQDPPMIFSFGKKTRRGRNNSVFDKFRDFESETKRQEEEMALSEASSSNGVRHSRITKIKSHIKNLEDLFRPPLDLIFNGNFQAARDHAVMKNQWLLVNIQNSAEFPCQVLNRDVWSNQAVRSIIKANFIIWQVYHDSDDGSRYTNYYPFEDWPYVAVIDPRTGEKMEHWQHLDAVTFCDVITEFLSRHRSLENSFVENENCGEPDRKKMKLENSVVDTDELEQIEMAIKASLVDSSKTSTCQSSDSGSDFETFDSDSDRNDSVSEKRKINDSVSGKRSRNDTVSRKRSRNDHSHSEKGGKNDDNENDKKSDDNFEDECKNNNIDDTRKSVNKCNRWSRNNKLSKKSRSKNKEIKKGEQMITSFSDKFSSTNKLDDSKNYNSADKECSESDSDNFNEKNVPNKLKEKCANLLNSENNVPTRSLRSRSRSKTPIPDSSSKFENLDSLKPKSSPVLASKHSKTFGKNNRKSDTKMSKNSKKLNTKTASNSEITDEDKNIETSDQKTSTNNTITAEPSKVPDSKWKLYLGKNSDPVSKIALRLPDSSREIVEMPCSSKLKALVLYVAALGYSNERFELVTNFPRRKLSYMDFDETLKKIGLFPQDTVFVQQRD